MTIVAANTRAWWDRPVVWLVLALFATLPVLVATLPGMPDLHSHVARYHVAAFGDDVFLKRYYSFEWLLVGNLGVDLIVHPLVFVIGAEAAGRVAVAFIAALSVLSIFALARAVWGRVPPQTPLALCMVWSFPLLFGFVNFALGIAIALLAAATWIVLRRRENAWRYPVALTTVFLIWISHVSALAIYLVIVGGWELAERWREEGTWLQKIGMIARDILPQSWPLAITLASGSGAVSLKNVLALKHFYLATVLRSTDRVFDVGSIGLIYLATAGLIALAVVRRRRLSLGMLVGAGALAVLFVILPQGILSGSYYADARLIPVCVIGGLLVSEGPTRRAAQVVALAGLALFAARTAALAANWHARSVAMERELAVIDPLPMGVRIAMFSYGSPCDEWPLMGYEQLASRAIVRRHAFVNSQWDLPRINGFSPEYNRGYAMNDGGSSHVPDPAPQVGGCGGRPLAERISAIPPGRFDYVWSFAGPVSATDARGLTLIVHEGRGWLYRVR